MAWSPYKEERLYNFGSAYSELQNNHHQVYFEKGLEESKVILFWFLIFDNLVSVFQSFSFSVFHNGWRNVDSGIFLPHII